MIEPFQDQVGLQPGNGRRSITPNYIIAVHDDLDVPGAVACLTETMELLGNHPNVDPMAFQGALMSALTKMGKD